MSLEDFTIKKKYVGIAIALGVVSGIIQFQCNEQNARKVDAAVQQDSAAKVKRVQSDALPEDAKAPADAPSRE